MGRYVCLALRRPRDAIEAMACLRPFGLATETRPMNFKRRTAVVKYDEVALPKAMRRLATWVRPLRIRLMTAMVQRRLEDVKCWVMVGWGLERSSAMLGFVFRGRSIDQEQMVGNGGQVWG